MQEQQLTVNDCSLYCAEDRTGTGRAVLLLHGAKFNAATWRQLGTLSALQQAGHPFHALDMPGFGKSPACDITPVEILQAFIRQEQLDRPVLVGPSMGGGICLNYYFTWPETVGGLVLVGSVGLDRYRDRFREIAVPCLLVWGENDTISPPANGRFLEEEIPHAELVLLEKAAHPCYLDQPETWHRALITFLERL